MTDCARLVEVINSLNDNVVPEHQRNTLKSAAVCLIENRFHQQTVDELYRVMMDFNNASYDIRELSMKVWLEFVTKEQVS